LRIPSALVVARSNSQGIFVFKITMEKKCTKCGEFKSLDEFNNAKKGKHGKDARCKSCVKDYREANKEKIKQYRKEYYKKNKEKFSQHAKEYYKKNKDKIDQYKKDYYKLNKVRLNEKSKQYRIENKDKLQLASKKYREKLKKHKRNNISTLEFINLFQDNNGLRKCNKCQVVKSLDEFGNSKLGKLGKRSTCKVCKYNQAKVTNKVYIKERLKTDPLFKLSCGIVANIRTSLIKNGYNKKTKTYNILKCDYDFFMQWLNGVASNGYTYGVGELHLDHVIPISLAETEDEAYLLNHYSNYQLLSADENLSKGNRYVNPTNLKRVLEHHPNPDKIREIHARL
jgi:hypothetical protein